jgi:hypothetical protein
MQSNLVLGSNRKERGERCSMYIDLVLRGKKRGESSTDWLYNWSLGRKGKYRGNDVHTV